MWDFLSGLRFTVQMERAKVAAREGELPSWQSLVKDAMHAARIPCVGCKNRRGDAANRAPAAE